MKILILDEASEFSLGMSYARAFRYLGHEVEVLNPIEFLDAGPAWCRRLSRRVIERRSLRKIEERLLQRVIDVAPEILWVGKGAWALPSFWRQLRRRAPEVLTVCYNADDPITTYSRGANRPWVTESVAAFDLFCTYKRTIIPELIRRGAREVLHVPFAWDDLAPTKSKDALTEASTEFDLVFVGNGDAHREQILSAILKEAEPRDLSVGVFGRWGRVRSKALRKALVGRQAPYLEMQRLVRSSSVSLNLLRRQNEGSHNMRTFEIAGAGGLMLSQIGGDQEGWFEPGRSALYFSTAREAVELAVQARSAPEVTANMKAAAVAVARRNTYRHRSQLILARLEEIRANRGGRRPVRIGVVATHPIQYQAPIFRELHRNPSVDLDVFFACMQGAKGAYDPGFGQDVKWDIPILEGYRWTLLKNKARRPSVDRFLGTNAPGIYREIERRQFDAVLIQGWAQLVYLQGVHSARRTGTKLLLRCEGRRIGNQSTAKEFVKRAVLSRLLRMFSRFLWIGSANRALYRWCGVDEGQMLPARYCIESARFNLEEGERQSARADFRRDQGISPTAVTFLFSGKFIEKKRPQDVLEAAEMLVTKLGVSADHFAVVLLGSGELESGLKARSRELGCQVVFTGFVNQSKIPGVYAACDCLVLPSNYWETWGLVVNEAMAAGLPAIVSDRVGCCEDLIIDGETGYRFDFGDTMDLARCMQRAIVGRADLPRMGINAMQVIREYSVESAAAAVVSATADVSGVKPN